jgi:hypothetical protein
VKAATLAAPPSAQALAVTLNKAALSARKSDRVVCGLLMVKCPLLSEVAILDLLPTASPTPPVKASMPILTSMCSQPQQVASMTTLVLPTDVHAPPLCMGSIEKLILESAIPVQLVQAMFDHSFNASTLVVLPLAAGLTHPLS